MSRVVLAISLLVFARLFATSADPPQAPAPRAIPIAELVEQLGTGPLAQREAAEARLSALAFDPPPPELLAALKSSGLDRRDRAARVIQAMRWNVVANKLPRGVRFADVGKVDLFVAATADWKLKADDDRLWEPAIELGRQLVDKAGLKRDRRPSCASTFRDNSDYKELYSPQFTRRDEFYTRPDPRTTDPPRLFITEAIQAPGVECPTGITSSIVVSRGNVKSRTVIQETVVFANGDVACGGVSRCIIVCDGDVTIETENPKARSYITMSFVVARGNITVRDSTTFATLIAGGKVTIRAQTKFGEMGGEPTITENEPNPLGFITFFELHRIGIEAKAADKVVALTAVKAGSAAAKAGLKVGDVVVAVGAKKPTDPESLRRALRDALALGDAALTVTRDGKPVPVKLALPA